MEMRELRGDDLFTMLSIIGKLDIEEEVKSLIEVNIEDDAEQKIIDLKDHKTKKPTKKEAEELEIKKIEAEKQSALRATQFGADMIVKLVKSAGQLKDEINPFLADLTDTDEKTIKELPLKDYMKLLTDFFKKDELKDFFSSLATLI